MVIISDEQRRHARRDHHDPGHQQDVARVPTQQRTVDQRHDQRFQHHRNDDEHIENAHVNASAIDRNGIGQHDIGIAHHAGPADADADHERKEMRAIGRAGYGQHRDAGDRDRGRMQVPDAYAAADRHHEKRRDTGYRIIDGSRLPGQQDRLPEPAARGIGGVEDRPRQRETDKLPIGEHRKPLQQHRQRQLPHRRRHIPDRRHKVAKGGASRQWLRLHPRDIPCG